MTRNVLLPTLLLSLLLAGTVTAQPTALLTRADGASGVAMYRLIGELQNFTPTDFSAADRLRLTTLLIAEEVPHRDRLFLLAGYLGMADALRAVPPELRRTERLQRSYVLALVRAGDPERRQQLLRSLPTLPYDDTFVYQVLPLLIYTHDRAVYDFLIGRLLRDNRGCRSADLHASDRVDCGYRLLEALAPVLADFPWRVGPGGDLDVADYPAALREARAWLRAHRQDYRIVRDRY
jgi:hypothetical protein